MNSNANIKPHQITHNQLVNNQFGSQADLYLSSSVHSQGQEFARVKEIVSQYDKPQVLDLGCGAGHISFCAAPLANHVIAYDLSQDMLNVVQKTAQQKQLNNISIKQGVVETLPFDDDSFDIVISRFSAHHWQDVPKALQEMRRVSKPNGTVMIIDIMAPPNPICDTFLQTIEILRDNSHVRDYSASEWQAMFSFARLPVAQIQTHKIELEFSSWVARMRTPKHFVSSIQALQKQVGQEVKDYFRVQEDGTFTTDVITLVAKT